jgi:hypothetical protein
MRLLQRVPELADDPDIEIGIHLSMSALARMAMDSVRNWNTERARATVETATSSAASTGSFWRRSFDPTFILRSEILWVAAQAR